MTVVFSMRCCLFCAKFSLPHTYTQQNASKLGSKWLGRDSSATKTCETTKLKCSECFDVSVSCFQCMKHETTYKQTIKDDSQTKTRTQYPNKRAPNMCTIRRHDLLTFFPATPNFNYDLNNRQLKETLSDLNLKQRNFHTFLFGNTNKNFIWIFLVW